jgi:tRNA A37 N6-isopentenylltransferase MiaA
VKGAVWRKSGVKNMAAWHRERMALAAAVAATLSAWRHGARRQRRLAWRWHGS